MDFNHFVGAVMLKSTLILYHSFALKSGYEESKIRWRELDIRTRHACVKRVK